MKKKMIFILATIVFAFAIFNVARADQDEPAEYICEEITIISLHPCHFRYATGAIEGFGQDARDGKAVLVETKLFFEWLGYFHNELLDIIFVDLYNQGIFSLEQLSKIKERQEILKLFLNYKGEESLLDLIRTPPWEMLAPRGGDSEEAILEKTRNGEWLIIDIKSFDTASKDFAAINISYGLAVLVEKGALPREKAMAFGIKAMDRENYERNRNLLNR